METANEYAHTSTKVDEKRGMGERTQGVGADRKKERLREREMPATAR